MSYHVVALTLAQVRQGALGFQRQLGAAVREARGVKVYSASPFDLDARRQFKERFGGDAAPEDAGAAESVALDYGDGQSKLGGPDCADVPCGSAANKDHIERSHFSLVGGVLETSA